jgi:Ran GTPase-activating protein (RanGAP) involved in mRNA processing and transport
MSSPDKDRGSRVGHPETVPNAQPVFYAFFPLACFISDNSSAEKNDSLAATQEIELADQFESPGRKVDLSGLNFSRWISLQGLCARLSKSDSAKSQIYLDNCGLGRHGAVVIARSFTHVFIRGGNYHAQWLPLMYQNSSINVLSIVNNNIGPDGAAAFAAMLRVNSGLRELNLSSNGIRCDGLQYLASALFVNDTLRFLCVKNNEICGIDDAGDGEYDASGLISLVRVLHENTTLKTLKIAENDIKDQGAGIFADALHANSGLRALDISGNNLFHDLEMSFGQGFALKRNPIILKNNSSKTPSPSKQLGVSGTPSPRSSPAPAVARGSPSPSPSPSFAAPAARTASPVCFGPSGTLSKGGDDNEDDGEVNPFMTDNLVAQLKSPSSEDRESAAREENRSTPISMRGMGGRKFVNALGENCQLTHIDLSFNDMGPKGAALLATSLAKCKSVHYLELKGNPIMTDGVIAIADMMRENRTIQILGLERTGIDARGISYFATILANYQSLKKLNISLNDIGDEGANKLTVNLKKNMWLKYLYLHRCNLGSDGVAYISSMLQVNHSIRHIGLSCNDIGETGMMALSATMLLNRSVVSLDISETKLRRRQGKVAEVGSEGWAALASMIRVNSHLHVLNITGYAIPNESLEELLEAMNARRVCLLKADFRDLKWKYDTILQAIDAERNLLSSTVKCSYTRIQLCGESGIGKTSALRRWLHLDTQSNPSPLFGTDFFGLGIFSQPSAVIPPTVGISVHYNTIGNMSVVSWDYGGMKPFQVINHLTLGDGATGRFVICASSVWGADKCRSYVHVADELVSWVRLIMTLGHKESDIAIVFLRGGSFDAAWRGKDPIACGNSSRDNGGSRERDPPSLERSRQGSFDAVRDRDSFGQSGRGGSSAAEPESDAWSSLQSSMTQPGGGADRDRGRDPEAGMGRQTSDFDSGGGEVGRADKEGGGDNQLRKHRMELQERELMVSGFDVKTDAKDAGGEDSRRSSRANSQEGDNEMLDISLTSAQASQSVHDMDVPSSSAGALNSALQRVSSMSLEKDISSMKSHKPLPLAASPRDQAHGSSDDERESEDEDRDAEGDSSGEGGAAPSEEAMSGKIDSSNSGRAIRERRRYFMEAVQERMASVLKWNRVPTLFEWDDGKGAARMPKSLPDWLGVRQLSETAPEFRIPKLCGILLDSCISQLKAQGEKVVSFDELLAMARHHIRSLMPNDLRVSLNWLHRTGYLYLLDSESEWYVSSEAAGTADGSSTTSPASAYPSEAAFPLESFTDHDCKVPHHIVKNSPLRSLGKFPLLKTKIVLDISWFFGSVIGSIISPRDILPPSIQHQLPWGDKDYLLSLRQLTALCESALGPIQRKISTTELICMVENMMLGAWCSSNYLFIPARLSGDKLRWLRQREIARMPLSQFGFGAGLPPVSAVMGRRIDVRAPYLLPSGMFYVLQCLLLQQYERSEWTGMSITCWESGIGIVANLPSKTKKNTTDPSLVGNPTTVCAIIEQNAPPKGVNGGRGSGAVDGMRAAGVAAAGITDVVVWGDGADCPLSAVQVLLRRCVRAVEQAVLIVLSWPPKPDKYHSAAAVSEKADMDDMKPMSSSRPGGISEDEEKFLGRVLRVEYLRPGCVLHTLALPPAARECAVYEDESLASIGMSGMGSPFTPGKNNDQLPIFVCCDHLQPRLCKHHLANGYVLADTPGGGRAVLRAVSGALERTLSVAGAGAGGGGGEHLHGMGIGIGLPAKGGASPSSTPLPADWNNELPSTPSTPTAARIDEDDTTTGATDEIEETSGNSNSNSQKSDLSPNPSAGNDPSAATDVSSGGSSSSSVADMSMGETE